MADQALRQRMLSRRPQARASWYEIRNQDGDVAVLRIYDEIHWLFGVDAATFADDLAQITAREIRVEINSPGGDVFDGIAIFNALRAHPARVTTRVDGLAASAASVVAQAGDSRLMMSGAQMMIHEAWGLAIGNATDMREMAELLDRQTDNIIGIYAERSGRDRDELAAMVSDETWFTAQEAVDAGLADEVIVPERRDDDDPQGSARPPAHADVRPPGDGDDGDDLVEKFREQLDQVFTSSAGEREREPEVALLKRLRDLV